MRHARNGFFSLVQIAKSREVLRAQVPSSEATLLTCSTKPTNWCGPQLEAVLKQPGYRRVQDRVRQREIRGEGRKNMSVSACLDEACKYMLLSIPDRQHQSDRRCLRCLVRPQFQTIYAGCGGRAVNAATKLCREAHLGQAPRLHIGFHRS